jgi:hypothetical protein
MSDEKIEAAKDEVQRLLDVGFIKEDIRNGEPTL